MKLGKIKEVDIRSVWPHEQYDFSKWLAEEENIRALGEEMNLVPSPKKQTKNVREKPNEKNDKYNMKLLYPTVFIPRFA